MSASLRVVFAGTPEFAVPCLEACLAAEGVTVTAVYTQPDRPAGRGRKLMPGPVKQRALEAGLPVEQPLTLKTAEAQGQLAGHRPDLLVVVAYGLILPQAVLDLPRLGCWNVHASLLPRWRGAAPIQRAIAAGDSETGVCLMQMEAGLDTGPVLLRKTTPIGEDDTAARLHDRLARLGAEVLAAGLARHVAGQAMPAQAQAETGIAYAHKLSKAEALLDPREPAIVLARKVRAFNPWPVAQLALAGETLRIWQARILDTTGPAEPGSVTAVGPEGIDLATGHGTLRITELQRPGGRRISATDYLNAHPGLRAATAH